MAGNGKPNLVPNTAEAKTSDETTPPEQLRSNAEVMSEDPDAGLSLEEQLGGVIHNEYVDVNGERCLLVSCIDCISEIAPEL